MTEGHDWWELTPERLMQINGYALTYSGVSASSFEIPQESLVVIYPHACRHVGVYRTIVTQAKSVPFHSYSGGGVLRNYKPYAGSKSPSSAFLGLIMETASQDVCRYLLRSSAISSKYHHAPKDLYPDWIDDSFDAAENLDNSAREFGTIARFLAGESTGASLAALTVFSIMRARHA